MKHFQQATRPCTADLFCCAAPGLLMQAGVAVGMKLTGISDPVRRDEVWQLQVSRTAAGAPGLRGITHPAAVA
jgi:hypothetical protein